MNHIEFGRDRDNRIVKLIAKGKVFTRIQLEQIIIPNKKSSTRIMRYRLQRLTEDGRIKRLHKVSYEPCIYFLNKPKNLQHALMINDVYCALLKQKHSLHRVDFKWSYSIMGEVIADAMATIYTDPDRKNRQVVWIEIERDPSKRFNKVEQYTKIFNKKWADEEWAVTKKGVTYFPTILIVTDEPLTITAEKPRFVVATTVQVQENIYKLIIRRDLM